MKEEQDRMEYAFRCINLETELSELRNKYESDRVWMAVIVKMIGKIALNQKNPTSAIGQVIDLLRDEIELVEKEKE